METTQIGTLKIVKNHEITVFKANEVIRGIELTSVNESFFGQDPALDS